MITNNKRCKLGFQIFSLLCLIAIAVCFVCNLAVNKGFTWSGYPLISILCAWAVITPFFLMEKHKLLSSLTVLTVITVPFLYFLEQLTPVKGWFLDLGVPIAIIGIIAMWITYVFLRFVKTNIWNRLAALVLLYGVVASPIINYLVDTFAGNKFFSINNMINFFSCIVVTALLAIIGHYRIGVKNNKDHNKDNS